MIRVFYYEESEGGFSFEEEPPIEQRGKLYEKEWSIVVKDMEEFYKFMPPNSRPTTVNGTMQVRWDDEKLEWVADE